MANLRAELKPFNEQVDGNFTNNKATMFAVILQNHGECQVYLASGVVHSIHLGDNGNLNNDMVVYQDRANGYKVIFWDQVESVDFHNGYPEG